MWFRHTHSTEENNGKLLLHFLSCFLFSLLVFLENPMLRQSKTKYEIVLKDETPGLESTQLLGRAENKYEFIVANEPTSPKPEGHVAADLHKSERKM